MLAPIEKWQRFNMRVQAALKKADRDESSLQILPVTKTHLADDLLTWFEIKGFPRVCGENYLQELQQKAKTLATYHGDLSWHFIGPLQSRKIEELCQIASVLQTVSRTKELESLKKCEIKGIRVPNFFLQVNVSGEVQKNGIAPEELPKILNEVAKLGFEKNMLGLMCLPESLEKITEANLRRQFVALRDLRDQQFPQAKLSMGMSADFELAIEEGSNLIRIGTALFGTRG